MKPDVSNNLGGLIKQNQTEKKGKKKERKKNKEKNWSAWFSVVKENWYIFCRRRCCYVYTESARPKNERVWRENKNGTTRYIPSAEKREHAPLNNCARARVCVHLFACSCYFHLLPSLRSTPLSPSPSSKLTSVVISCLALALSIRFMIDGLIARSFTQSGMN